MFEAYLIIWASSNFFRCSWWTCHCRCDRVHYFRLIRSSLINLLIIRRLLLHLCLKYGERDKNWPKTLTNDQQRNSFVELGIVDSRVIREIWPMQWSVTCCCGIPKLLLFVILLLFVLILLLLFAARGDNNSGFIDCCERCDADECDSHWSGSGSSQGPSLYTKKERTKDKSLIRIHIFFALLVKIGYLI